MADSADWVEFYNRGNQAVDLAGWSLSDSSNPRKYHCAGSARSSNR